MRSPSPWNFPSSSLRMIVCSEVPICVQLCEAVVVHASKNDRSQVLQQIQPCFGIDGRASIDPFLRSIHQPFPPYTHIFTTNPALFELMSVQFVNTSFKLAMYFISLYTGTAIFKWHNHLPVCLLFQQYECQEVLTQAWLPTGMGSFFNKHNSYYLPLWVLF